MGKPTKTKKTNFRTSIADQQMKIRVPAWIKTKIEKSAKKNGRSRVAEILVRLARSFQLKIT